MNNTVSAVFPAAVEEVLLECGFADVDVRNGCSDDETVQLSVSIGLTGRVKGFFVVGTTLETALGVAHDLGGMMGIDMGPMPTMDDMHRAALSELANQISGRAAMHLSDAGFDTDITPPTIMSGDGLTVRFGNQLERWIFSVCVSRGTLRCELVAQVFE